MRPCAQILGSVITHLETSLFQYPHLEVEKTRVSRLHLKALVGLNAKAIHLTELDMWLMLTIICMSSSIFLT